MWACPPHKGEEPSSPSSLCPLLIEGEQMFEHLLITQIGGPAIGGGHGGVEQLFVEIIPGAIADDPSKFSPSPALSR